MTEERTTDGKRIVYAPQSTRTTTGIISVALEDNENVRWYWSHSEDGSVVTGYSIIKSPNVSISPSEFWGPNRIMKNK